MNARVGSIQTDERFAIVPAWVERSGISDKALRLYTILAGYADWTTGDCNPKRKTLAARLSCSVDTVDRAKKELVSVGALSVSENKQPGSSQQANDYVVHRIPPGRRAAPAPRRTDAAQPSRNGAAPVTRTKRTRDQLQLQRERPAEVDKQEVTAAEAQLAEDVLGVFNAAFGTRFTAVDYWRGVVMRLREHPELGLGEYEALVGKAQRNPWWKGDPSPAVIFGNARTFERTLNGSGDGRAELDALQVYNA